MLGNLRVNEVHVMRTKKKQKGQSNDSTDRFPKRALTPQHSTSAKT